jgi:hypothetical protein
MKDAKLRSLWTIEKPREGEYPAYAHVYIDLLPDDGKILKHLADNFKASKKFIRSLPKDRLLYRYAEGKWTVKEILGHIRSRWFPAYGEQKISQQRCSH